MDECKTFVFFDSNVVSKIVDAEAHCSAKPETRRKQGDGLPTSPGTPGTRHECRGPEITL